MQKSVDSTALEDSVIDLLKQAQLGDSAAFESLLEQSYDMIYQVAYSWVGQSQDAEDIAQEVCIKLATAIQKFKFKSKFSTWLYRVTLNTAKDYAKKQRYHESIDELPSSAKLEQANIAPNDSEQQDYEKLWILVRQLPAKQCDAVLLVYAQGLNHSEAAQIMQCAETTISWYIHQAKKKLKTLIPQFS